MVLEKKILNLYLVGQKLKNNMRYISGRGNLACTIFVPWDCNNNCPFCTSKPMYKEMKERFNLEEIINKIYTLNHNHIIREYVLTGGEIAAMAVIDSTIRLIDGVITKESHEKD